MKKKDCTICVRGYRKADLHLWFRVCKKGFLLLRLIWAFKKLSFGFRPQSDTNWVVQLADQKLVISDIYIYIYIYMK